MASFSMFLGLSCGWGRHPVGEATGCPLGGPGWSSAQAASPLPARSGTCGPGWPNLPSLLPSHQSFTRPRQRQPDVTAASLHLSFSSAQPGLPMPPLENRCGAQEMGAGGGLLPSLTYWGSRSCSAL